MKNKLYLLISVLRDADILDSIVSVYTDKKMAISVCKKMNKNGLYSVMECHVVDLAHIYPNENR